MKYKFDWEDFYTDLDELVDSQPKSYNELRLVGLPAKSMQMASRSITVNEIARIAGYFNMDLMLYCKRVKA